MPKDSHPVLKGGENLRHDVQLSRGGSEKFHPFEPDERRSELAPQVSVVRAEAAALPPTRRGERVIVELTLLPNYLASTYQPAELLAECDMVSVGSRLGHAPYYTEKGGLQNEREPTKTLQVAATDEGLRKFEKLTTGAVPLGRRDDTLKEQLRTLWTVELPGPSRVVVPMSDDVETLLEWEAVLHPAVSAVGLSRREQARLLDRFSLFVESLGGEIDRDWLVQVADLTYLPLTLSTRSAERLGEFNPLKHVRPQPVFASVGDDVVEGDEISDVGDAAPFAGRPVAVFDLGADANHPLFAGAATVTHLTDEAPTESGEMHGSLVTSAVMHGPLFPGSDPGAPNAPVHHFRIGPPPQSVGNREVYWALDQIVTTLKSGKYGIAVITTAPERSVGSYGDAISSWTAKLDQLALDEDVLIVTAAGNTGTIDPRPDDESDRVAIPSDAVNGMSVGSATGEMAAWERCDYSSRGPGRAGSRVQPTVFTFGGERELPFYGATPDGGIGGDWGTSFAAPAAAGQLARLAHVLGDAAYPETLRAFAVHKAGEHRSHDPEDHGYGLLPADLVESLEGGPDEITVLYQLDLVRNQPVSVPVPAPVRDGGNFKISWTISYLSRVDPTNPPEYTHAGLEVQWRPNSLRFQMKPPLRSKGQAVKIDLTISADAERYEKLLAKGWRPANPPTATRQGFTTEKDLREERKWETVVRERAGANAKSLNQPTLWLNYLYRRDGVLQPPEASPELPVSLLVTVRGKKGCGIYAEVAGAAPFNVLTPVGITVPVRS